MMQHIRDRVLNFLDEAGCRLSFFFYRLKRSAAPAPYTRSEPIRGTSHNVILVTPPDTEIFREALFILRDDYMRRSDTGREELLRQARAAAESCAGKYIPPRPKRPSLLVVLLPVLTAALGFAVGRIM